jgi:hypothetical protein
MRSYSNSIKNEFNRFNFLAVDCVSIALPEETLRLCTGGWNLTFADSSVYTSQGDFMNFTTVSEDLDVKVGRFNITLSGVTSGYVDKFINKDFEGCRVKIYKVFLNYETAAIVDEPIVTFDGYIYNVGINEGAVTCTINIQCSTLWADFERTTGRMTNNNSNWWYQGSTADTCFEKAAVVGNSEFLWGRK